jgi:hypothetical protein
MGSARGGAFGGETTLISKGERASRRVVFRIDTYSLSLLSSKFQKL